MLGSAKNISPLNLVFFSGLQLLESILNSEKERNAMSTQLGWFDHQYDDPGDCGVTPTLGSNTAACMICRFWELGDRETIKQNFYRDGFVVVGEVLTAEQVDYLAKRLRRSHARNRRGWTTSKQATAVPIVILLADPV